MVYLRHNCSAWSLLIITFLPVRPHNTYCPTFIGFLFDIELTLRWPWRSSNASMVWPHSTWPMTVFWPRLCACSRRHLRSADTMKLVVQRTKFVRCTTSFMVSADRKDKDRHRHQGLCSRCCYCMEQTTDYQLTFELLRARFRHLHRNWKLFMPAGASEDFFYFAP